MSVKGGFFNLLLIFTAVSSIIASIAFVGYYDCSNGISISSLK